MIVRRGARCPWAGCSCPGSRGRCHSHLAPHSPRRPRADTWAEGVGLSGRGCAVISPPAALLPPLLRVSFVASTPVLSSSRKCVDCLSPYSWRRPKCSCGMAEVQLILPTLQIPHDRRFAHPRPPKTGNSASKDRRVSISCRDHRSSKRCESVRIGSETLAPDAMRWVVEMPGIAHLTANSLRAPHEQTMGGSRQQSLTVLYSFVSRLHKTYTRGGFNA
jgi:hypothetical protein